MYTEVETTQLVCVCVHARVCMCVNGLPCFAYLTHYQGTRYTELFYVVQEYSSVMCINTFGAIRMQVGLRLVNLFIYT